MKQHKIRRSIAVAAALGAVTLGAAGPASATLYPGPNGSFDVSGAIEQDYLALGGPSGKLGGPVTNETGTPDGVGRYNHFDPAKVDGSIYWTSGTGAQEVQGDIKAKWAALGWETSVLGYPTTNESPTPNKPGEFNHFQGGSVYWSAATGAHEIQGAIQDKYASLGWENSSLGFPTSDQHAITGGERTDFEGGYIEWSAATGALVNQSIAQAAPTGVTATANSNNTVTVAWTAAPYATSYEVWETTHTPSRPVATVTGTTRTSGTLPAGNYTYSVDAVGPNGISALVASSPATVTIGAATPPPTVVAPVAGFTQDKTSGVAPVTVAFTDTSSNAPTAWSWNFGDGTTSTAQNPSHTYATAGTRTVTLTASNSAGSSTKTSTVTVTAPSTAKLPTAPPVLVNPSTYYVTDTASGRNITLDQTKDWIVKFPSTPITGGGVSMWGGHNVVVIGGDIEPAADTTCPDPNVLGSGGTTVFYPHAWRGSMHIEGMKLGNTSGCSQDLIRAQASGASQDPNSTFTVENIDARSGNDGFYAYSDGTKGPHADVFQFYTGNATQTLNLNHIQGEHLGYQGVFLQSGSESGASVAQLNASDISLKHLPGQGGYNWSFMGSNAQSLANINLYQDNGSGNGLFYDGHGWSATQIAGSSLLNGKVIYHPTTDATRNVLIGTPGANYVSPGYAG